MCCAATSCPQSFGSQDMRRFGPCSKLWGLPAVLGPYVPAGPEPHALTSQTSVGHASPEGQGDPVHGAASASLLISDVFIRGSGLILFKPNCCAWEMINPSAGKSLSCRQDGSQPCSLIMQQINEPLVKQIFLSSLARGAELGGLMLWQGVLA